MGTCPKALSPGRRHLTLGIGPRVKPLHLGQPIEQPELNQKHAWPLCPEIVFGIPDTPKPYPESLPACVSGPSALGTGHHGSKATLPSGETGTVPFQGARLLSIALRGGGWTTDPCPATSGRAAGVNSTTRIVPPLPPAKREGRACALRREGKTACGDVHGEGSGPPRRGCPLPPAAHGVVPGGSSGCG
eukprot:gene15151-biopygen19799